MKQSYGVMPAALAAPAFRKPYFIVERAVPNPGSGESALLYLVLPGEWREDEEMAMRFPQRVLAESYARRFKGKVVERAP